MKHVLNHKEDLLTFIKNTNIKHAIHVSETYQIYEHFNIKYVKLYPIH